MNGVDGIAFIDKPYGLTSHKTAEYVKKILNARKAGHTGTLDPKVTGLLIVLLGKATRLAQLFNLDKTYVGVAKLHADITINKLKDIIKKKFIGPIKQVPPKRSAVKRQERERHIYEFIILEKKKDIFLFKVKCEAGTYVRKLIHDLGKELGGAHMLELRRVAIGPFSENETVNLYNLTINNTAYIENTIKRLGLPEINISDGDMEKFCHGALVPYKSHELQDKILIFNNKKLYGIAKIIQENNKSFIKPDVVIC